MMSRKKGFTIIEVSLVIAIAGLIFLMVFVALPGLRASQRDNARRDDIMNLVTQIKNYQSNNRGGLPDYKFGNNGEYVRWPASANDGWNQFYSGYLGEKFVDPDGSNYVLHVVACNMSGANVLPSTPDVECSTTASMGTASVSDKTFPNGYNLSIVIGAVCSADKAVGSSNPRNVAVLYKLEGAGIYCHNT